MEIPKIVNHVMRKKTAKQVFENLTTKHRFKLGDSLEKRFHDLMQGAQTLSRTVWIDAFTTLVVAEPVVKRPRVEEGTWTSTCCNASVALLYS